jgi:hypothetical protein
MPTIYNLNLVLFQRTFAIRQRFITVGGWDEQLDKDVADGKLEDLAQEAIAENPKKKPYDFSDLAGRLSCQDHSIAMQMVLRDEW